MATGSQPAFTILCVCHLHVHVSVRALQVLAQGIYDEFQAMMEAYGQESISNLMPLVVNVLENLDSALVDNQVPPHVCMCMWSNCSPY